MTSVSRVSDDHFQAWMQQLNEACGHFGGRRLDAQFTGRVDKRERGFLSLSIVDMQQVNLFRGPKEILASGADNYYAVLQMTGSAQLAQRDARVELNAGDLTLIDASQPLDMHFHGQSKQLSLILPRAKVESAVRGASIECARRICGRTPLAVMTRQLLLEASRVEQLAVPETQAVLDSLITLMQPSIIDDSPRGSHERLFQKAVAVIDRNIACEQLSPDSIADEVGVSMRTLYRIFSKKGLVIAQYIRNRRLDLCAEVLRNPAMDQKISTLGYSWGFNDSSYFCTAFKNRFGATPGEYRKRHIN